MTTTQDEIKEFERYLDLCPKPPRVVPLMQWRTPASAYRKEQHGRAAIVRRYYDAGYYMSFGVRDADLVELKRRIRVTCLEIAGQTWMVDDPWHYWTIEDVAAQMHGRVLVGGLGLGLIVHALRRNTRVTEINVIERDEDVIALIGPHVRHGFPHQQRCNIVRGDLYDHVDDPCDFAFVDLWVTHGREETRAVLHREVYPLAIDFARNNVPMYALGFTGTKPILS